MPHCWEARTRNWQRISFAVVVCWCSSASAGVGTLGGVAFGTGQPQVNPDGAANLLTGSGYALPKPGEKIVRVRFYAEMPASKQLSWTEATVTGDDWSARLQLVPGRHDCWVEMIVDVKGGTAQKKYTSPVVPVLIR